jgi:hypothetical protein
MSDHQLGFTKRTTNRQRKHYHNEWRKQWSFHQQFVVAKTPERSRLSEENASEHIEGKINAVHMEKKHAGSILKSKQQKHQHDLQ